MKNTANKTASFIDIECGGNQIMTPEQRQEVFDRVCTYLLTQGADYTPEHEGFRVREFNILGAVESSLSVEIDSTSLNLLKSLQYCHDLIDPIDWQDALENVADIYGLEMNCDT